MAKCSDDFLTEIKLLSRNCNFCDKIECFNSLLRDWIVGGIRNDQVREKLLAEKKLTLEKAIGICRSSEKALDGMEALKARKSSEDQVDRVGFNRNKATWSGNQQHQQGKKDIYLKICRFCQRKHQYGRDECPAWGKKCQQCGLLNHFASSPLCKQESSKKSNKEFDSWEGEKLILVHCF